MKSKAYRLLLALLLFVSLSLHLCSCYKEYNYYIHDLSMVVKVDIVEYRYDGNENMPREKVLLTIDDVKSFTEELSLVRYKVTLSPPYSWEPARLGIKLTYENGDYQVISDSFGGVRYYNATNEYDSWYQSGYFEEEKYAALLNKYFTPCETPIFGFINDTAEIEKIEIVDAYYMSSSDSYTQDSYTQDKIAEVKDISLFLDKMDDITYKYEVKNGKEEDDKQYEHHKAIKIYYTNGDYEIFDNNWRNVYIKATNQFVINAYIGEFNEDEFNALLKETIKNNSVSP